MAKRAALFILAFFAIAAFMFAVLALFVVLDDYPFGFQVAATITYSAMVFWHLFLPSRSGPPFKLRNSRIKQALPYLLRTHATFVAVLIALLTGALALRPYLPSWVTIESGPKHQSWYSFTLIVLSVILWFTQIHRSRKYLDARGGPGR